MRTLSATLTANQKAATRPPLLKLVLTKAGEDTQTFKIESGSNRLVSSTHIEQEWSQIANIAVMSDSTLAALSLEGYAATISYGYNDATNGDEYSACAPLEVIAQNTDTLLDSKYSGLVTWFSCAGAFDMMQADHASEAYTQESDDSNTVKDLLSAIAGATLTPFDHCQEIPITYDSEDSLIDSYVPADYFQVSLNESRLSAFKKLINTTKCKARVESDGIHVFNPTVSGTSYDYQYNDAATNHNFFEKGTRSRVVIPTKWIVSSAPGHSPSYSGTATDSTSETAIGRSLPEHRYIRATSNAECAAIAAALLQHEQVAAEKGHGIVPMNCGQETMDYIKITDSVAGDNRVGNVSYIKRDYTPGSFRCEIRFGKPSAGLPFLSELGGEAGVSWEAFYELVNYIDEKDQMIIEWLLSQLTGTMFLDTLSIYNTIKFYGGGSLRGYAYGNAGDGITLGGVEQSVNILTDDLSVTAATDVGNSGIIDLDSDDDITIDAGDDMSIEASDEFHLRGDRITLGSGTADPGGAANSITIQAENDVNIYSADDIKIKPDYDLLLETTVDNGGDIILDIDGYDLYPADAAGADLGTNTYYFDTVECVTLDDGHSPAPAIDRPLDALRNMKTYQRTITTEDVIKEGLGRRLLRKVEDAGGSLTIPWKDKSSYPSEILHPPTQEDIDKDEQIFQKLTALHQKRLVQLEQLRASIIVSNRKKQDLIQSEAGQFEIDKVDRRIASTNKMISYLEKKTVQAPVKPPPTTPTSVFDEVWFMIEAMKELADKVDSLTTRIQELEARS